MRCGYHYVVIRYRPDPIRGEFVNLGVVVQDRDTGKTYVKVDPTLERVPPLFPEANLDMLRLFLDLYVGMFEGATHPFGYLEKLASDCGPYSMLILSEVRGGLSQKSEQEVEFLYDRYVAPFKG